MPKCDACGTNEATFHVTLHVNIFGPRNVKSKSAQFWLCEPCEYASQQILRKDVLQRSRLAFRFVDNPNCLSPTGPWRKKDAPDPSS